MKWNEEKRLKVVQASLQNRLSDSRAAKILSCSRRTIERYRKKYLENGVEGLKDHRGGNNRKLTEKDINNAIRIKKQDRWRSGRNVRDPLGFKVHEITLIRLFRQVGLSRENLKRVKPIKRFESKEPNDLWQADIMGKMALPKLGDIYLIAALDDHSRFCLSGRWFFKQSKINVFHVWYKALSKWGLPKKMLQDAGSQYKARTRFGNADYQWYAHLLKIQLIWARRAQTKGKIERFWRFVQSDFVRSVWNADSLDHVNKMFDKWLYLYNYNFKSRYSGGSTRSSRYKPSHRRISQIELQSMLAIEERRKVTKESSISLFGKQYVVPHGYIDCRIWVKIIGDLVLFEADGRVFHKTKLILP